MTFDKKLSIGLWIGFLILIAWAASAVRDYKAAMPEPTKTAQPKPRAEPTQSDINRTVAVMLAGEIRNSMKDPNSFTLTWAAVMENGDACYDYRAANSFGGIVPGKAVFIADGPAIFTHDQHGSAFSSAWNRVCAGKAGENITAFAQAMAR